jgi:hypothetical protein
MIEIAQVTGTQAVIKSPHFDRLTPRVSRLGRVRRLHHLRVLKKARKKYIIKKMNKNHSQYQYCNICKKVISECIYEGEAKNGSG